MSGVLGAKENSGALALAKTCEATQNLAPMIRYRPQQDSFHNIIFAFINHLLKESNPKAPIQIRQDIASSFDLRYSDIVSILLKLREECPMAQDHRPRSETRQMMIEVVAKSEKPLTRSEIANRVQRKKTPHLVNMMDSLVEEGIFARSIITFNNGVTGYVYSIAGSRSAVAGRAFARA
ncbi:MAG: hypothetical protein OXI40_05290 [Chloroflexota bacterium]|nr:hypothetical protein [Chloroflexota bacterium]